MLVKFFSGGNTIYCLFLFAWEQFGGKLERSSVNAGIVTISEGLVKLEDFTYDILKWSDWLMNF